MTSSTESGWSCSRHSGGLHGVPLGWCVWTRAELPDPPRYRPATFAGDPHPARPPRAVDVERRRSVAGAGRPAAQRARRGAGGRRGRLRAVGMRATRSTRPTSSGRATPPSSSPGTLGARRRSSTRGCASARAGEWEGLHPRRDRRGLARVPRVRPAARRATSPTTPCSPGCSPRWRRSRAAHDGDVLVVTHGGVVRAVERHLGGDADGLIPNLGGPLARLHDGSAAARSATGSCCSTTSQVTTPEQI